LITHGDNSKSMILQISRLMLRPFAVGDLDRMVELFAHENFMRPSGTLIDYCGFLHQEVDGKSEIEIGYCLDPQFWNRGLATEAARAVRDQCLCQFAAGSRHLINPSPTITLRGE
jgi:Acetyltransferase (GNAT) domain